MLLHSVVDTAFKILAEASHCMVSGKDSHMSLVCISVCVFRKYKGKTEKQKWENSKMYVDLCLPASRLSTTQTLHSTLVMKPLKWGRIAVKGPYPL